MIFSESNQKISAALVSAWGKIETPKHNTSVKVTTKSGGTYEFSYTDLDGIFEAIKEVYKENKIAVLQNAFTERIDGVAYVSVETMLLHESGEWVKSEPLRAPAAQSMQDLGGQITYMKRYSLSAMLGIATEKDDDANGVVGNDVEFKKENQRSARKKDGPPASLKAKYQLLMGSMDGFEEYLQKMTEKGRTYPQIEHILQDAILQKKEQKGA